MEEAELAAHANTWIPSEPLNQDMDSQLRYLLVMLTSGPALLIIRQQPSGVQAFRDLARRYNPRSQARSWAQLQEIMHLDFGQEPAGVTDRTIVFERLVGENETSSGEALGVQVKCAVLLERVPPELRTHLFLTCGSRPDYAIMRQTVESYSVARQSWQPGHSTTMGEAPMEIDAVYGDRGKKGKHAKGKKGKDKAKESTTVNTRAVLSLRATAVTVEVETQEERLSAQEHCCRSGGGVCRTSKQQCEQQHDSSWFVFSWNCAVHDGDDLHADGGSRAVWLAL